MVSLLGTAALIIASVIGTVILFRHNPEGVTRSVRVVDKARWIIGIAFLALAAYHLILSGDPGLIAIAVAGFAFLTGYALVERPWQNVI